MVDQPPDALDSRFLSFDDWLGKMPADSKGSPTGTGEPVAAVDEPPDPVGGGPPLSDALYEQNVEDRKQNRSLREKYADKAYQLAFGCLWWWAVMLVASGVVNMARGEPMWSDKVLIAVTTGVTVSVLAAFLGVIRGLFPGSDARSK